MQYSMATLLTPQQADSLNYYLIINNITPGCLYWFYILIWDRIVPLKFWHSFGLNVSVN